nr:hypothetical protein [Phyllobacterium sp. IY22]
MGTGQSSGAGRATAAAEAAASSPLLASGSNGSPLCGSVCSASVRRLRQS